jgi:hypothetical protein
MTMAAAAAAPAAALGLGGDEEEEDVGSVKNPGDPADDPAGWETDSADDKDDPPLDEEAIEHVFGYMELSAEVTQDKLGLNEPVDLIQTWDSDAALESACNNLSRGANNYAVDDEVPVFRFSMSQDLILYREWVRLRLSRGLGAEAEFFRRTEWAFMHNWQHALKDIKGSIKLSAKSESDVLKFDAKDWLKWFKSIDNFFRRTLGMRGVTLDWIYRDDELPPRYSVKYPSIAAELRVTLLLARTSKKIREPSTMSSLARLLGRPPTRMLRSSRSRGTVGKLCLL